MFEGLLVICAKTPFLHSVDVLIKMFANSLTVLNQQTLGRTDHVHCFQMQLMESCLVVWFWVDKRPVSCFVLYKKTVWIPRLGSGLMVSGTDITFIFYSLHVSVYGCTNDYMRCTKCEVQDCVRKHVIRCMKKRVPRFQILEALYIW